MKEILRIPKSLVDTHSKDIYILVDTDNTCAHVVMPRVRLLKALPYEVNIDETSTTITTLLSKEVDNNAPYFVTFEEEKEMITTNL